MNYYQTKWIKIAALTVLFIVAPFCKEKKLTPQLLIDQVNELYKIPMSDEIFKDIGKFGITPVQVGDLVQIPLVDLNDPDKQVILFGEKHHSDKQVLAQYSLINRIAAKPGLDKILFVHQFEGIAPSQRILPQQEYFKALDPDIFEKNFYPRKALEKYPGIPLSHLLDLANIKVSKEGIDTSNQEQKMKSKNSRGSNLEYWFSHRDEIFVQNIKGKFFDNKKSLFLFIVDIRHLPNLRSRLGQENISTMVMFDKGIHFAKSHSRTIFNNLEHTLHQGITIQREGTTITTRKKGLEAGIVYYLKKQKKIIDGYFADNVRMNAIPKGMALSLYINHVTRGFEQFFGLPVDSRLNKLNFSIKQRRDLMRKIKQIDLRAYYLMQYFNARLYSRTKDMEKWKKRYLKEFGKQIKRMLG